MAPTLFPHHFPVAAILAVVLVIVAAGFCACGRGTPVATGTADRRTATRQAPVVARGARLEVRTRKRRDLGSFCKAHDLVLIPVVAGKKGLPVVLKGSCGGPCTATDLAWAKRNLAKLQAEVDAGRAADGQLDYNFTECLSFGLREKSRMQFGNRTIAILEGAEAGPHDIPNRFFQMATVVCGRVFVSKPFGATYGNRWTHGHLRVSDESTNPDRHEVVVRVASGVLYRVVFGRSGCATRQQVFDAEALWRDLIP